MTARTSAVIFSVCMPANRARIFAPLSSPLLKQIASRVVAEHRGASAIDLRRLMIVVPGARARRALIQELTIAAAHHRALLLPPTIITPGELPELTYQAKHRVVSDFEEQIVWNLAVARVSSDVRRVLGVPEAASDNPLLLRSVAETALALRREIAGFRKTFADVVQAGATLESFDDEDRWEALQQIDAMVAEVCRSFSVCTRDQAREMALQENEESSSSASWEQVIVAGCTDLLPLQRAFLERLPTAIEIVVYADERWADGFDMWGCIVPGWWRDHQSVVPEDQIHIASTPADQSYVALEAIRRYAATTPLDRVTIGICDEEVRPFIERVLHEEGLPVHSAPVRRFSSTRVGSLLEAIRRFVGEERYHDGAALVRHGDMLAALIGGIEPGRGAGLIASIDKFYEEHLPERFPSGAKFDARCSGVGTRLRGLLGDLCGGPRPISSWNGVLRGVIDAVYEHAPALDDQDVQAFEKVVLFLGSTPSPLVAELGAISAADALQLITRALRDEAISQRSEGSAIELVGWLELPLDCSEVVVAVGCNEGKVPESVTADPFLPDTLRRVAGLLDNERRAARDAYVISVLSASREAFHAVLGKSSLRGDPLLPSRLLVQTAAPDIAGRVRTLYGPGRERPRVGDRGSSDSFGEPPRPRPLSVPIRSVSVSGVTEYLTCPYHFYLAHALKLRESHDDRHELDAMQFGILAHEVVQVLGSNEGRYEREPERIRQLLDQTLNRAVEERYGRDPMPAIQVQTHLLRERLRRLADWEAQRRAAGWQIDRVEWEIREPVTLDNGVTVVVSGRIDRIDRHRETRQWQVIDYKFGDAPARISAHLKDDQWLDLQLPVYHRCFSREAGGAAIGVALLSVTARGVELGEVELSTELMQRADETLRAALRGIVEERFWPPAEDSMQGSNRFKVLFPSMTVETSADGELVEAAEGGGGA